MDLADLIAKITPSSVPTSRDRQRAVSAGLLTTDSRKVKPGGVFVTLCGVHADGHDYIEQAIANGAAVIVAQRAVPLPASIEQVQVENTALALGQLARAAHRLADKPLMPLAVTGTNGKTTVAYLTRHILRHAGLPCGLIGTIEYDLGDEVLPAGNTTPDALQLAGMFGRMYDAGLRNVVMECSSHGLQQDRTAGIDFATAAFTNLTGDHLDYHGNRQSYLNAKAKLFQQLDPTATAILNDQDPASVELARLTPAVIHRYAIDAEADIAGHVEEMTLASCQWRLTMHGETLPVHSPLIGRYNVANCLAAAGLAQATGATLSQIARGIESFCHVPGRLERIDAGQPFTVWIDYAHTDDALGHVLGTLRGLAGGRVILVFGCGGCRDRAKRPRMASVAEKFADVIILTNDNPRTESPQKIIAEIKAGFSAAAAEMITTQPDRSRAIEQALNVARRGDLVLIAGKGHEDYQLIGKKRLSFDDRHVARRLLGATEKNHPAAAPAMAP